MENDLLNLEVVTKDFNDSAICLIGESYWFSKAKKKNITNEFLKNVNEIIQKMLNGENQKLKEKFGKIIGKKAKKWTIQYDERFIDIFIEILGFGYLASQGYKPSFFETPDLLGYKDGQKVVVMECKNFLMSQCERDYLQSTIESTDNITARKVEEILTLSEFKNPFYRKFIEKIDEAQKQVSQITETVSKRIIFINFSFDAEATLQKQQIKENLLKPEAERLNSCDITLICFENYDLNQILI